MRYRGEAFLSLVAVRVATTDDDGWGFVDPALYKRILGPQPILGFLRLNKEKSPRPGVTP
jgi:hypothetical protein